MECGNRRIIEPEMIRVEGDLYMFSDGNIAEKKTSEPHMAPMNNSMYIVGALFGNI